jgi:GT2 family glycosyltransferase
MNKTLVIILNHNRKAYTNQLYETLIPYAKSYDVEVLDNGSTNEDEVSQYTSYRTDQNCYYGGALNLGIELFLQNIQYDSLLFMNNDIILHGYTFVDHLRHVMFTENFGVVSPSVLQPEVTQCYWKQMHNYSAPTTRTVKWVDFMCPLIRRDVAEAVYPFHHDLLYGWGQDVYTGLVCEERGWKIGVTDHATVIHMSSQTFKDNKSDITTSEYGNKAMAGMVQFFSRIVQVSTLNNMRAWGSTYSYVNER